MRCLLCLLAKGLAQRLSGSSARRFAVAQDLDGVFPAHLFHIGVINADGHINQGAVGRICKRGEYRTACGAIYPIIIRLLGHMQLVFIVHKGCHMHLEEPVLLHRCLVGLQRHLPFNLRCAQRPAEVDELSAQQHIEAV